MHDLKWFLLIGAFVVLPMAVGTWRGFARVRRVGPLPEANRNPGPAGGYALGAWGLTHLPMWFMRGVMVVGTTVGWATLPGQRANSRRYLRLALGRAPTWREVWRHFFTYTEYFALRLRICEGKEPRLSFAPGEGDELRAFLAEKKPALYGTMHVGHSDLLGFLLVTLGGHVHMVRRKVGNSDDVGWLAKRYAGGVTFVWINDWSRLILAMNDALRDGHSLAMQCDRSEHSSKRELFDFLGERLPFPFTIYHLSIMHALPVVLSYATSAEDDPESVVVHVRPMFRPQAGPEHRTANFAAARAHFQAFLAQLETQLRRTPYLWFNFTPMNPPRSADVRRRLRGVPAVQPTASPLPANDLSSAA